jgi:O-acetyl-ADP-ribose deacetylase (regulator of RNase III)
VIIYMDNNQDIFLSPASIIVIPVNTVGVPGKGLALQWARKYPGLVPEYRAACQPASNHLEASRVMFSSKGIRRTSQYITDQMLFCLFATKEDWRQPSRYSYIRDGLAALVRELDSRGWTNCTIAFPPIGCGLGSLDWQIVQLMIEAAFSGRQNALYLYGPKIQGGLSVEWNSLLLPGWRVPEGRV